MEFLDEFTISFDGKLPNERRIPGYLNIKVVDGTMQLTLTTARNKSKTNHFAPQAIQYIQSKLREAIDDIENDNEGYSHYSNYRTDLLLSRAYDKTEEKMLYTQKLRFLGRHGGWGDSIYVNLSYEDLLLLEQTLTQALLTLNINTQATSNEKGNEEDSFLEQLLS